MLVNLIIQKEDVDELDINDEEQRNNFISKIEKKLKEVKYI